MFKSHQFQRVYQYLSRYSAKKSLDNFNFTGRTEGKASHCLKVLLRYVLFCNVYISFISSDCLRYCGLKDPSWSEVNNFVNFLSDQLELCEQSTFCQVAVVGDVLAGFKQFVVDFMIRMSKVCMCN